MTEPVERLKAALSERYTIDREIGRGGMATVHLAHDLRHHRDVAIKILRPELALAIGGERFEREIAVAASLTHPHILGLHDSGHVDGILYFVMPYIEGPSLRQKIDREGQLDIDDAVHIAAEVADALEHAHAHGIVHRDIKPENILLQSNHAYVADFGIALVVNAVEPERITNSGMSPGTPRYMSPEQASGEREVDARTDVYSLGCVLYEMLTGEAPYGGPNARAVIAKKMYEPVPGVRVLRDTVSSGIEVVTRTALARSPADRYTTAREFANALRAAASGDDVRAPGAGGRTDGRGGRLESSVTLTPARAAAIGLLAFIVVVGVGFLTTTIYQIRMEIPPRFAAGASELLATGVRALIPITALLIGVFIAYIVAKSAFAAIVAGLRGVRLTAGLIDAIARRSTVTWTVIRRSVPPTAAAEIHLVVSLAASALVLWLWGDYLLSLGSSGPDLLACEYRPLHRSFTPAMIALMAGIGLSWHEVSLFVKRRGANRGTARLARWCSMAWLIVLLAATAAPWRVVWNNDRTRALIEGRRAYVLLESETEMVVFDAERRATTVYPLGDPTVTRLPTTGYVFESAEDFAGPGPGC